MPKKRTIAAARTRLVRSPQPSESFNFATPRESQLDFKKPVGACARCEKNAASLSHRVAHRSLLDGPLQQS
jgi:hypothetical protein